MQDPSYSYDENGVSSCKSRRKYNQDEVVLTETPIIPYVKVNSDFFDGDSSSDSKVFKHVCLTCFVNFDFETPTADSGEALHKCRKCKWIFCSNNCSLDKLHADLECHILEKYNIEQHRNVYEFISLVRIIQLKYVYPKGTQWPNILTISHGWKGRSELDDLHQRSVEFLQHRCKYNIEADIIKQLVNLIKYKSFDVYPYDVEGKRYFGAALYNFTSMIEHSCSSNCEWTLLPLPTETLSERWWLKVTAKRYIYSEEKITIAYLSNVFQGTEKRRQLLYQNYGFHCACDLCLDPTEYNTNMSALVCNASECKGLLLPVEISDTVSVHSPWKCHKCGKESPFQEVNSKILSCETHLSNIDKQATPEVLQMLEEFVQKWTGSLLFESHYLILQAELRWLQCANANYTRNPKADRSLADLVTTKALKCRKLLKQTTFGWNSTTAELDNYLGIAGFYLSMVEDPDVANQDLNSFKKIFRKWRSHMDESLIYIHSAIDTWNKLPPTKYTNSSRLHAENYIKVATNAPPPVSGVP